MPEKNVSVWRQTENLMKSNISLICGLSALHVGHVQTWTLFVKNTSQDVCGYAGRLNSLHLMYLTEKHIFRPYSLKKKLTVPLKHNSCLGSIIITVLVTFFILFRLCEHFNSDVLPKENSPVMQSSGLLYSVRYKQHTYIYTCFSYIKALFIIWLQYKWSMHTVYIKNLSKSFNRAHNLGSFFNKI